VCHTLDIAWETDTKEETCQNEEGMQASKGSMCQAVNYFTSTKLRGKDTS